MEGFDDFLLLGLVDLLCLNSLWTASRLLDSTGGEIPGVIATLADGRGENIPGPSTQPWRTPKETGKGSDSDPSVLTSSSWLEK